MDQVIRNAALLLRKGQPLTPFVGSLDNETKQALLTDLLADLYPTFYDDWFWLNSHPSFASVTPRHPNHPDMDLRYSMFMQCLDIMVSKVDPTTGRIEDKVEGQPSRNTHTEFWLECGAVENVSETPNAAENYSEDAIRNGTTTHDYELDCGGASFQEAIVKLAALVKKQYGEYSEAEAIE